MTKPKNLYKINEHVVLDTHEGYIADIVTDIMYGTSRLIDNTTYHGYIYKTLYIEEEPFWWTEDQLKKFKRTCSWAECVWQPKLGE